MKIAKGVLFSWFWKRSFIYINLKDDPQNDQKKGAFFLKWTMHPNSSQKIAKCVFFSWFWKRSFIYINLMVDPQNDQKKGAFFWNGPTKIGIFSLIFIDELRCVFPIFMKKNGPQFVTENRKRCVFFLILKKKFHIYKSQDWSPKRPDP